MAGVFETVHITWQGTEFDIVPDMETLNRIENQLSLSRLAHRLATGDAPLSHLATVMGILLRDAGADAPDDEVYQELMTGDVKAVQDMAGLVMQAVFPQPKKSTPSPAAKAPAKRRKS